MTFNAFLNRFRPVKRSNRAMSWTAWDISTATKCPKMSQPSRTCAFGARFQSRLLFIISLLLKNFLTALHVTMVAKFLDLNNLSRQRRPFTSSNDVWATVLFLSTVMHRKVIQASFFRLTLTLPTIFVGLRFVEI